MKDILPKKTRIVLAKLAKNAKGILSQNLLWVLSSIFSWSGHSSSAVRT